MKVRDITRRAGRSLRQAKARTLLTSLAIGVGAFTITLSLAAGAGGRSYTNEIVSANTDVSEISVNKAPKTQQDGPQKYSDTTTSVASTSRNPFASADPLTQADITAIGKLANVATVSPSYSPQVKYVTRPGQDKYVAPISTFSPSVKLKYAAGSVTGDLDINGIILTQAYAKALGFNDEQSAIGQSITIVADQLSAPLNQPQSKSFTFVIRGVSDKSGLALRAQSSLLISNTAAKELYDYINQGTRTYQEFMLASVRVTSADKAEDVKAKLVSMGYEAQTAKDVLGTINTFINVLQGILLGFGALAVLTSIFGIINTQYISVLERTQQIGLMKALGMRRRDVGRLFKFEAAWIGFLGGTIGAGLAFVTGMVANPFISKALDIGNISLLIFNPLAIMGVVAGLMVVSVGAGILPARKASKLDPIEALRTE
jgi:putative ABC transport system permease protein